MSETRNIGVQGPLVLQTSIGVISPYKEQIGFINNMLNKEMTEERERIYDLYRR